MKNEINKLQFSLSNGDELINCEMNDFKFKYCSHLTTFHFLLLIACSGRNVQKHSNPRQAGSRIRMVLDQS